MRPLPPLALPHCSPFGRSGLAEVSHLHNLAVPKSIHVAEALEVAAKQATS
jgi:hypothetical protein